MVALLTKWFAVSLEKVLSPQLHVTLAAGEAAGMPGAAQRGDHLKYQPIRGQSPGHVICLHQSEASTHLAHDGLLAGGADPLLLGLDPLLGHVLLQVTQHRVQAGQAADNLARDLLDDEDFYISSGNLLAHQHFSHPF